MKHIKFLLALNLLLAGCGSDKPAEQVPTVGGGAVVNPGSKIGYQEMQSLMNDNCKSCHATDTFIQSEAGLKASKVQLRLTNKSMPPSFAPKALPDNVRTQMLSYF